MRILFPLKIVRVALALSVALWMAGAGCLLGCENNVMAAANAVNGDSFSLVVSGDACASHSTSADCCAKHVKPTVPKPAAKTSKPRQPSVNNLIPALGGNHSSMMENCPLAVNSNAALSKARQDPLSDGLPVARAGAAQLSIQEQTISLSSPLRLPNRGHTYLHCCVFLI